MFINTQLVVFWKTSLVNLLFLCFCFRLS